MYGFINLAGNTPVRKFIVCFFVVSRGQILWNHDLVDQSNQKLRRQWNVICMLLPSFVQSTKMLLNVLELLYK